MDDQIKNAEESFQIIRTMIENEKARLNENGFVYLFWGWMVIVSALLQYALIYADVKHHYFAWLLMLAGFIFMPFYYSRRNTKNVSLPLTGRVIAYTWIVVGLNIFAVGFLYGYTAGKLLMFIILMLVSIGTTVSGLTLRFKWLVIGGLLCNLLAFMSIYLNYYYWGVLAILAVIVADLIPGYILRSKYRNSHV